MAGTQKRSILELPLYTSLVACFSHLPTRRPQKKTRKHSPGWVSQPGGSHLVRRTSPKQKPKKGCITGMTDSTFRGVSKYLGKWVQVRSFLFVGSCSVFYGTLRLPCVYQYQGPWETLGVSDPLEWVRWVARGVHLLQRSE